MRLVPGRARLRSRRACCWGVRAMAGAAVAADAEAAAVSATGSAGAPARLDLCIQHRGLAPQLGKALQRSHVQHSRAGQQGLVGAVAVPVARDLLAAHGHMQCLGQPRRQRGREQFGTAQRLGHALDGVDELVPVALELGNPAGLAFFGDSRAMRAGSSASWRMSRPRAWAASIHSTSSWYCRARTQPWRSEDFQSLRRLHSITSRGVRPRARVQKDTGVSCTICSSSQAFLPPRK